MKSRTALFCEVNASFINLLLFGIILFESVPFFHASHQIVVIPLTIVLFILHNICSMSRKVCVKEQNVDERNQLIKIIESTSDLVALATLDRKVLYMNSAGKRMLGLSQSEGSTIQDIGDAHPSWVLNTIFNEGIPTALAKGVWNGETVLLHSSGKEIPVSQVIMAHKDSEGNVDYLSTIMRDISDRKEIERDILNQGFRIRAQQAAIIKLASSNSLAQCSFDDCLGQITELAAETLSVERASIWLFSEDKKELNCIDLFEKSLMKHSHAASLDVSKHPKYFNAIRTSRAIDAYDVYQDERTNEFAEDYSKVYKISSLLDAPIRLEGVVVGVACFEHTAEKRFWTNDEIAFAGELADQVTQLLIAQEKKKSQEALKRSEGMLQGVFRSAPIGIAFSINRNLLWVNNRFCRMLGYSSEELVGQNVRILYFNESEYARVGEITTSQLRDFGSGSVETKLRCKNGEPMDVWLVLSAIDPKDFSKGVTGTVMDISGRKKAEEVSHKLSRAVEQSPGSIIICDIKGTIEYINSKFTEITGYLPGDVVGQDIRMLRSDYVSERQYKEMWRKISSGREWSGELCSLKKNGDSYWEYVSITPIKDTNGVITNYLVVKEDLTVRKEFETRLEHQANFDALTDLPNRVLAFDRLSQAIVRAQRTRHIVSLMFVDLDQFKIVNETLGHSMGDMLIIEASRRLKTVTRDSDTIARLGGDEFLVILPDLASPTQAEIVAKKILEALSRPYLIEGREIFMTASIGITICPDDGDDPVTLLRNADAAMFRAKDESRNTLHFFTHEMNEHSNKRMGVESQLRHAQERGELFLVYQPLIDVSSGKLFGTEALLRWKNDQLGIMPPNSFIPLAEETGLIVPIGEWVLETACAQIKQWEED
ncbi:MAG: PAS domain S-box protein, partial [Candidatus Omnitrophica bacterium]|nr:PAS domain S-box protein [Candidatus Omnitrophota bacterium]